MIKLGIHAIAPAPITIQGSELRDYQSSQRPSKPGTWDEFNLHFGRSVPFQPEEIEVMETSSVFRGYRRDVLDNDY